MNKLSEQKSVPLSIHTSSPNTPATASQQPLSHHTVLFLLTPAFPTPDMSIALQTADQLLGFLSTISAMQLAKKPFMLGPEMISRVRIGFVAAMLLQVFFALVLKRLIAARKETTTFKFRPEGSLFMAAEETEEVEMTVYEYDTQEANKLVRSAVLYGVLGLLSHWKWGVIQPLLVQGMALVRAVLFNPLYHVYFYRRRLARPFEKAMLFGGEEAPVAAAERRRKKEE